MKNKANIPFAPAKFPFFYGWISVIAGTIGILFSIPGQTMGVSIFTDYLIEALDISRDALSTAYMIGTVSSSLFLTNAGRLYDKFGARITSILAAFGLATSLVLISFSVEINSYISDRTSIPYGISALLLMAFFFFLLRFSGQGVLTLASRNLIMKWFIARRGLANSISSAIQSFGFSLSPLLLSFMVVSYDWQTTYQILALSLLGFIVFAFIFYRDNPEECGLIPDGKIYSGKKEKQTDNIQQYTLKEAQKTWGFWVISLSLSYCSFFITGLTFNIVSIFECIGFDRDYAFSIFVPASVISVAIAIVGNIISDYFELKYLIYAFLVGALMSSLGLAYLENPIGYYSLIGGNGLMGGLFSVLAAISWPKLFGRKYLGEISGRVMSFIVFGSAIAPLFFSRIFTITGNYAYAGFAGTALSVLLLLLSLKAKRI